MRDVLPPPRPLPPPGPAPPPPSGQPAVPSAVRPNRPYFCYVAMLGCIVTFIFEVRANGWEFQPLTCSSTCDGRPCNADGTSCESNLLLGPRISVLDELGAKNDAAIFDDGQWWRVFACNWMHAGFFHLLFNLLAVRQIGFDLERVFGWWRICLLYLLAGLFGTIVSIVFLPGTLSVGASASVFGLLGAVWADIIINYCARGTLRGSAICGVTLATVFNLVIGLTPWVDNFMHLGGMLAGLVIGLSLFARKKDSRVVRRDTSTRQPAVYQDWIVLIAVVVVFGMVGLTCAVVTSSDLRDTFRSCSFCEHINCIPIDGWWSCCMTASAGGTCQVNKLGGVNGTISALCNMTGAPAFTATCSPLDDSACVYAPNDAGLLTSLCSLLCVGSC